ncbi:MAG: ABC-2 transporter permease [Roseburia sp.]|nr:ABC-2 transporter permease [Roseburia sp.]MCM1280160.1 ABC-2 transporter permease [Robinsoniella sp.]
MVGLIRKDMYCLRRNLKTFLMVSIGVIIISVLFILSARYGNVAKGIEEMKVENHMGEEDFYAFFQVAIWCVLLLPMSFLGIIAECFKEDKKAGFSKQMLILPLSDGKIVGSRYISCLLLSVISLADSLLAGFFVSLVSEAFPLQKMLGCILCFNGALLAYMSLQMFLIYVFGAEKSDLMQCVPLVLLLIAVEIYIYRTSISGAQAAADVTGIINQAADFMMEKYGLILLAAMGCMALSFLGSWKIFQKRRGVI